jgi:hypothetical protein
VNSDYKLISAVVACERMGLEPEGLLESWWVEPLIRIFPSGRRELAVRLPSWLLEEEQPGAFPLITNASRETIL